MVCGYKVVEKTNGRDVKFGDELESIFAIKIVDSYMTKPLAARRGGH